MKRFILLLLVLAASRAGLSAWEPFQYPPSLKGGNILIDAGAGYTGGFSEAEINIPPLFLSADYCLPVRVPVSAGAFVGLYRYTYENDDESVETGTFILGTLRANWHWNINLTWLDLYTGFQAGYLYFRYNASWLSEDATIGLGGFILGGQAGARFYFTKNFGILVEGGYPYLVKCGLTLKF